MALAIVLCVLKTLALIGSFLVALVDHRMLLLPLAVMEVVLVTAMPRLLAPM